MSVTNVPFTTEDRQWDARFNMQTDVCLELFLVKVNELFEAGRFKYCLVSGLEVGTRSYQDDYNIRHVHCAFILWNRMSKASLLKHLEINTGNGYYLVPRNRDLPYSGWRDHHIKEFSKVDVNSLILFEKGELPTDIKSRAKVEVGPEEKKRKLDDILIEMRTLIDADKCEEAWTRFPKNYLTYGEKIKSMVIQKRNFFNDKRHPNIWLYGYAGTGKTALMAFLYPNYYKKNLTNKFFDLFDPKIHSHVLLEDLDHEAVDRLGINFIKTICDEAGFPIDQKYKTPQLIQTTCLVTSNFSIVEILNAMENQHGLEQNKAAILRRFYHVRIDALLMSLGLKLLPKWDRIKLQKDGNNDPSKLFYTYDYTTDTPLCMPLKSPEMYQEMIRDNFYG